MEFNGFLRILIIGFIILLCYGGLKLISYTTKGRITADFFAAINAYLYLGLILSFYLVFEEPAFWIILLMIIGGLLYRRKRFGRWI